VISFRLEGPGYDRRGQVLLPEDTAVLGSSGSHALVTLVIESGDPAVLIHKAHWERMSELAAANERILTRMDELSTRRWWRRRTRQATDE
jgi:PHD/YefM family antitoxin component YafN of YafNO toxin-antitoxin module